MRDNEEFRALLLRGIAEAEESLLKAKRAVMEGDLSVHVVNVVTSHEDESLSRMTMLARRESLLDFIACALMVGSQGDKEQLNAMVDTIREAVTKLAANSTEQTSGMSEEDAKEVTKDILAKFDTKGQKPN